MNAEKFKEIIELDRELKELEEIRKRFNDKSVILSYVEEYRSTDFYKLYLVTYDTLKPFIKEADKYIKQQVDNRIEELEQRIKNL